MPARHIALVGLPGAGKSTVGCLAAATLGLPFLDFDTELVARTGLSVADQFARFGEPAFRAAEVEISREIANAPATVLAPGGGWMANAAARAALDPSTCTIYLRVTPAVAAERLAHDAALRPLLASAGADPAGALATLLARRTRAYEAADTTIDTNDRSADVVAAAVVATVRAWEISSRWAASPVATTAAVA